MLHAGIGLSSDSLAQSRPCKQNTATPTLLPTACSNALPEAERSTFQHPQLSFRTIQGSGIAKPAPAQALPNLNTYAANKPSAKQEGQQCRYLSNTTTLHVNDKQLYNQVSSGLAPYTVQHKQHRHNSGRHCQAAHARPDRITQVTHTQQNKPQ